jgi:predicted Fe-Mo cluster-binding NifX family protein
MGDRKVGPSSRQRNNKEKIAICSFRDRVCPRFDLTHEMLIFDGKRVEKEPIEKVDVSHVSPERILNILREREVRIVVSGGIQERFQEMFRRNNIDVIWGVAGDVGDVVEAYTKGALFPGIGPLSAPKGPR